MISNPFSVSFYHRLDIPSPYCVLVHASLSFDFFLYFVYCFYITVQSQAKFQKLDLKYKSFWRFVLNRYVFVRIEADTATGNTPPMSENGRIACQTVKRGGFIWHESKISQNWPVSHAGL